MSEKQEENQDTIIEQSADISKLAEALSVAQGEMPHAELDGVNTFFKKKLPDGTEIPTKYATLKSLIDASKPSLAKQGLSVSQIPAVKDGKPCCCVQLMHKSGQWLRGYYPLLAKTANDPQSLGAAMTYARRHSLGGMVGLAAEEDDDGNSQSDGIGNIAPVNKSGNKTVDKWWKNVIEDMSASTSQDSLQAIYVKIFDDERFTKLSKEQVDIINEQHENRKKFLILQAWVDNSIEDLKAFKNLEDLEGFMRDIRAHGNSKVVSKEMGARVKKAYEDKKAELQNTDPIEELIGPNA